MCLMSTSEVAEYLNVSRASVARLIADGTVAYRMIGRRRFVTKASVDSWLMGDVSVPPSQSPAVAVPPRRILGRHPER